MSTPSMGQQKFNTSILTVSSVTQFILVSQEQKKFNFFFFFFSTRFLHFIWKGTQKAKIVGETIKIREESL